MRIAKLNHSCLAIENNGLSTIIDPGNYSIDVLDVNILPRLDYLLITHEHADHCDIPLVKSLIAKFPNARVITTNAVKQLLEKEGITAAIQGDTNITVTPVQHEKIWMGNPAENVMFTIFGKFSHPGDSLSFQQSAEVLALPIAGPWASMTRAVDVATKIKPRVIIPIHDFQLKDDFRAAMYQRLQQHFATLGIDFKPIGLEDIVEV